MGNCFSTPEPSAPVAPAPATAAPAARPVEAGPVVAAEDAAPAANGAVTRADSTKGEAPAARIAVIYYSTYGHIATLAKKVLEGANSVPGVKADLFQVAETLPAAVLEKIHAPPKDASVPIIEASQLPEYDGFIFGFPTRFGTMPAQFKAFLDATGGLWASGALVGKGASIFTSSGTQGGGIETTVLTSLPVLVHHGIAYIPTGYSYGASLFSNDAVRGGTAYGVSTLAGADGSRQPTELELGYAVHQGKYVAGVIRKLAA
ncbi:FAP191B [Auxenochlorella protothecoides x Auxenochlorella symbiontica]